MTSVPMQVQGLSKRLIQWSPCSQFVSMTFQDGDGDFLSVLNTSLEELYRTPPAVRSQHVWSAWSPDCTLIGAHCFPEPGQSRVSGMCWHPSESDPTIGQAARQAEALLAGVDAAEYLQALAAGPGNAFAAVAKVFEVRTYGAEGAKRPCKPEQHKLYVLLPKSQLASMVLPEKFVRHGMLEFSPTGDQLLMGCGYYGKELQLVSSTCQAIKSFPKHKGTFHPDGSLIAVVGAYSVKLVKSADGQQVFSMSCSDLGCPPVRFNGLSNRLMLGSRIVIFGLDEANLIADY